MKRDILAPPPAEIFKNQPRYARWFVFFLALAVVGLLLGLYAYLTPASPWYDILEKLSMILFVGSSVAIFITGEKLQAYKRLTGSQEKELACLCEKYEEIHRYHEQVQAQGRRISYGEFNALKEYGEERDLQRAQAKASEL